MLVEERVKVLSPAPRDETKVRRVRQDKNIKIAPRNKSWILASGWRLFGTLFLTLFLPTGLFVFLMYVQARHTLKEQAIHQNNLATQLASQAVREHFEGLARYMESFAQRPSIAGIVYEKRNGGMRIQLRDMVTRNPKLDRAFITDLGGVEWFDYPHDPTVIGKNFSFRDWYQGVSITGQTYISEVYQRSAEPLRYVVAIATPIRNAQGETIAYLVGQHTIESLSAWFAQIQPSFARSLTLIDHHGNLVTRLGLDRKFRSMPNLSEYPLIQQMLASQEGSVETRDPLTGEHSLISYVKVALLGWTVVSIQPVAASFAPLENLRVPFVVLTLTFLTGLFILHSLGLRILLRHHLEQNEIETALRETEGRLQAILENTTAVIYVKDLWGRYLLVNRRYEDLLRVPRHRVKGKTDYELFPIDTAEKFWANDRQVLETKNPTEFEEVVPHEDGLHTYLSIKFPLYESPGVPYAICGISTDITERKRAEEKLRRSEEKFRILAETANDGILSADSQGIINYINKGTERIFGYKLREVIGKHFTFLLPERFHEFHKKGFQRLLELGETTVVGKTIEMVGKRKDGSEFPSEVSVASWKAGRETFFTSIIRDVTERRRAEEAKTELAQKELELTRSNAEREQLELFAFVASHDLQEPLHKIIAFGDLLKMHNARLLDEKGNDYLARMQNAALRMSQVLQDLLKFSRVTTETKPFEDIQLKQVMQEVMKDLELRVKETGAQWEVGDLPVVHADRGQMRQLFQNLIANALKFQKKGEPPQVAVRCESFNHGMTRIIVQDNGIGFDEKYLDRIFKPFERLHSQSEYQGSGMGLAICQKIVSRHGGEITARSAVGKGSTFIVTLPSGVTSKGVP